MWKITKNNRKVVKGMVQGILLARSAFWKEILKRRIAKVSNQQEFKQNGAVAMNTVTVFLPSGRPGRKIELHYPGTRVDWQFVGGKLAEYSALHSPTKILKVELVSNLATQQSGKRKSGSTTQGMRLELENLLQGEAVVSGSKPSWPDTYEKFRCTDLSCSNAGHYCWYDPLTRVHNSLQPQDLQILGKNGIMSYESVPAELRKVL